jgi:2-hydroxy-3-keto-5-methylthiopentenyl-1-phosphate phosphatase
MEPKVINNSKVLYKLECELIKHKEIVQKYSYESGITHTLGFSTENKVINDKISLHKSFIDKLNDIKDLITKEFDEICNIVSTEKIKEGG